MCRPHKELDERLCDLWMRRDSLDEPEWDTTPDVLLSAIAKARESNRWEPVDHLLDTVYPVNLLFRQV